MIAIGVASLSARWRSALPRQWRPVGAYNRDALMTAVREAAPELCLLYLGMPGLCTEDLALLHEMSPETKLLAFADGPSKDEAEQLVRAGVHGYLSVTAVGQLVAKAIQAVLEGDLWVGRRQPARLMGELRAGQGADSQYRWAGLEQLTLREGQIADRVAAGEPNHAIAERLDISEGTLDARLSTIFAKTGAADRVNLARLINSL